MRLSSRLFALMALAIAAMLVVTACGGDDEEDAPARVPPTVAGPTAAPRPTTPPPTPTAAIKRGGTINRANSAQASAIDFHATFSSVPLMYIAGTFSTFLRPKFWDAPVGETVGDIATSWTVTADGKEYLFKVRQGVTFHDGSPMTVEDVKWSLDRYRGAGTTIVAQNKGVLAPITAMDVVDASTLKMTLSRPAPSILEVLGSAYAIIISRNVIKSDTQMTAVEHMVGTGPFILKKLDRAVGSSFVRNPTYYEKDLPYVDAMETFYVAGDNPTYAALQTGRVNLTGAGGIVGIPNLKKLAQEVPGFTTFQHRFSSRNIFGTFNPQAFPAFADVRVRKAIQLAIDQNELVLLTKDEKAIASGASLILAPWNLPATEDAAYVGKRGPTEADRVAARKLLADAGYPNGLNFVFNTSVGASATATYERETTVMLSQLQKIGITGTIQTPDYPTYLQNEAKGTFQFLPRYFCSPASGSGDPEYSLMYYVKGGTCNVMGWFDQRVEDLYQRQLGTADIAARLQTVQAINRLVVNDLAWVFPIYTELFFGGYRPEVKGYPGEPATMATDARNIFRYERVWLDTK